MEALKTMENNKSPGNDGIPEEFYKILWNDISHRLGKLPMSQRRGIINLIHKKNTIPYYLKNWRPITLLNCDYKIAAKAIANRSKIVLPSLINNDQTTRDLCDTGAVLYQQGCSLSSYIFIVCVELLANSIRRDHSQYADDTTLFLDSSKLFQSMFKHTFRTASV